MKYIRCKECKELISPKFLGCCPNCENKNPLSASAPRNVIGGKRGAPTLDIQERTYDQ